MPSNLSKRQVLFCPKVNYFYKIFSGMFSNHSIYRLEPIKSRFSIHRVNIRTCLYGSGSNFGNIKKKNFVTALYNVKQSMKWEYIWYTIMYNIFLTDVQSLPDNITRSSSQMFNLNFIYRNSGEMTIWKTQATLVVLHCHYLHVLDSWQCNTEINATPWNLDFCFEDVIAFCLKIISYDVES